MASSVVLLLHVMVVAAPKKEKGNLQSTNKNVFCLPAGLYFKLSIFSLLAGHQGQAVWPFLLPDS